MKKIIKRFLLFLMISFSMIYIFGDKFNDLLEKYDDPTPSSFIEIDHRNIVQNAKRLPFKGENFESFNSFLSLIGRTHVHSLLKPVILETYKELSKTSPHVRWIYGETGWKNGERLWPHKTHRNGLCVDFMVPVLKNGSPFPLPTSILNAFGYNLRFDNKGRYKDYTIDFEQIVEHLAALKKHLNKVFIRRIIFDLHLLDILKKEKNFYKIKDLPFMEKNAWIHHDSHYHIDFEIS